MPVDNVPGRGARFAVVLPLGRPPRRARMSRILLVEDQANVRRSMSLLLERDGHSVIEAATVAEALRLADTTPLDVVVTDVRIDGSGSDGVRLLHDLRARTATSRSC